jgi:hypothetical protein
MRRVLLATVPITLMPTTLTLGASTISCPWICGRIVSGSILVLGRSNELLILIILQGFVTVTVPDLNIVGIL